ncbi:MAG: PIN domain-containing protein [Proteobacteria bacterium]|nr:PIN domain-containing protein [Pseudomonadota bacterium]
MPYIISDANIFIDIRIGGLTRLMFQLPDEFAVPNILFEEELSQHHPELPAQGLQILEVRDEYVKEAEQLGITYPKPSHNDLLALVLAKQEESPLLTGDSKLREAALAENIEVHGTLWLMEKLFDHDLISIEEAEDAYEDMRQDGRRLPWDEVDKQLEKIRTVK